MGYISCKADPDLWYKAETRPADSFRYFAYILCYVDDILCVHYNPMSVLDLINGYMPLKPSLVGDPDIYLGAKLKLTWLNEYGHGDLAPPNMSPKPSKIVLCIWLTSWTIVSTYLSGQTTHFPMTITPESETLDPECSLFYQHLIGVMRWMVELRGIDIATKVSPYPLTLRILVKDILRQHCILCLICAKNIIQDLFLTQHIPKFIWECSHNIIGPNFTAI